MKDIVVSLNELLGVKYKAKPRAKFEIYVELRDGSQQRFGAKKSCLAEFDTIVERVEGGTYYIREVTVNRVLPHESKAIANWNFNEGTKLR